MTKRVKTMSQVYKDFMAMYKDYDGAMKKDYLKVQYEFSVYIDNLNKSGVITDKQAQNAIVPKWRKYCNV